ncbi:unnamed protein product [Closterium sp. Yama58-4]|nr:unnamed protein product [Closterium sp. Yama58-4]
MPGQETSYMASGGYGFWTLPTFVPLSKVNLVKWQATFEPCVPEDAESDEDDVASGDWLDTETGRLRVLACMQTIYSRITILEFAEIQPGKAAEEREQQEKGGVGGSNDANDPSLVLAGSRVMLLDDSSNVSSLYNKRTIWTRSYWDNLASLAPLLSHELGSGENARLPGPVALLGLAGGSVARIIRTQWPEVGVQAWEIDLVVVDMARRFFSLASLEKPSPQGGYLHVTVGDALVAAPVPVQGTSSSTENVTVDGATGNTVDDATAGSATAGQQRFSGIIVDLFSGGAALLQLADEATWRHLKNHLSPGGRVLINCGGPSGSFGEYLESFAQSQSAKPEAKEGDRAAAIAAAARSDPGVRRCAEVIEAMRKVFDGQVLLYCTSGSDRNIFALTGPPPDYVVWEEKLPEQIKGAARGWSSNEDVYSLLASKLV